MTRLVRLTLRGPEAAPGSVAAADVARAILGLERAMQRAASVIVPTPRRGATGRHTSAVERASHLRFVGTNRGSFRTVLALPETVGEDDGTFAITVADLSDQALERVLDAIDGGAPSDRDLAAALAQMGDELGVGDRATAVMVERVERPRGRATRGATIDGAVRIRMRQRAAQQDAELRDDTVTGALVEADFENNTARLRVDPATPPVIVSFAPELADAIQAALRSPAELEGVITYDPNEARAVRVNLRSLRRGEQLHLGDTDAFWRHRSIEELAREQGVVADVEPGGFAGELSDHERAELAALVGS
jgi:hypothetical protein